MSQAVRALAGRSRVSLLWTRRATARSVLPVHCRPSALIEISKPFFRWHQQLRSFQNSRDSGDLNFSSIFGFDYEDELRPKSRRRTRRLFDDSSDEEEEPPLSEEELTQFNKRNERITSLEVLVIDFEGNKMGVIPTPKAIEIAKRQGKDLVMVAMQKENVVCRIMNPQKAQRSFSRVEEPPTRGKVRGPKLPAPKDMLFRLGIADHDLDVKAKKMRSLLLKKHPTTAILAWKNSPPNQVQAGLEKMEQLKNKLADVAYTDGVKIVNNGRAEMLFRPRERDGGADQEE